ncbi:MAG: urate hydroxylase PuuD, partial [Bdellovibrionota bacterium]
MNSLMAEWLNLLLRWAHLITGIAWIGSSFYFMWLDSSLEAPPPSKKDVEGELWMVHSGGFYLVERKLIEPGSMPKTLHWFKYEALFTLITGFLLLNLVYYFSGGAFLLDPSVSNISHGTGVALGLGVLIVSWIVYDLIWQSKLALEKNAIALTASLALACGAAYVLCHYLSGRAAFIHLGAMFGTIMVVNVWMRILPSQQKMIDATKEGRKPDYTLSAK